MRRTRVRSRAATRPAAARQGDFDKIKVSLETKSTKKDMSNLVAKFNDFEKHTTNLLKLLDERSKMVKEDLEKDFRRLKEKLERKMRTGPIDLDAPDEPARPVKAAPSAAPAAPGADGAAVGADVAGGDVKKTGMLKGFFRQKVVEKTLAEGAESAGGKPAEPPAVGEKPAEPNPPEKKA
jgi:hypothetical protein